MGHEKIEKYAMSLPKYLYDASKFKKKHKSQINGDALDLLLKLLRFDPNKRISVDEALNHCYLQNIRSFMYERKYCNNCQQTSVSDHNKFDNITEILMNEIAK